MKLSQNELRIVSAALSHAIAATTPGPIINRMEYENLRTKVDRVRRQMAVPSSADTGESE